MYLTTHAAVGILISQAVNRPIEAFVLSFVSHFVLDFVPHGDENVGGWVRKSPKNAFLIAMIDILLIFGFLFALYATQNLPVMARISAGIIGAVLPDFLSSVFPVIHYYTSWLVIVRIIHRMQYKLGLIPIWRGHDWIHKLTHRVIPSRVSFRTGLIYQAVLVIACLAIGLGLIFR
ncbi:MAG: hypothetical protein HY566_01660 [Candidatus Kerfeldbacteria bacterium]|nr:hypothetical protein [Candidatus Kerfeldbacteria bacterium]